MRRRVKVDAQGRAKGALAGSQAGDEIGDLSRSFSSVLDRLSQYAGYRENMASRLSHELRTPLAVVRSSLDNLRLQPLPEDARVYIERAQGGLQRLAEILTRMTEATRLEQSLRDVEQRAIRPRRGGAGLRRRLSPGVSRSERLPATFPRSRSRSSARRTSSRKCWTSSSPTRTNSHRRARRSRSASSTLETRVRLTVENEGPPLPQGLRERLFDSMVSVRPGTGGDVPHLGLGLYIVRLIAEFHGGTARAEDREDGKGVAVTIVIPAAAEA